MAHEIGRLVFAISSSDIKSKWSRDTEKAIRGLFNLARLLNLSTIFIDEANALLRARGSDDPNWERACINQFLTEMDGLLTEPKSAPFILIATNFPQ
jgi:SpoVK/Ycf46/Vps4 family AAA+-type ATPase